LRHKDERKSICAKAAPKMLIKWKRFRLADRAATVKQPFRIVQFFAASRI